MLTYSLLLLAASPTTAADATILVAPTVNPAQNDIAREPSFQPSAASDSHAVNQPRDGGRATGRKSKAITILGVIVTVLGVSLAL